MNELINKIALVTGASSGIGKAITKQLIAKGAAKVYVNARSHERLESLLAEYPGIAVPVVFDVSDEESMQSAVKSIDRVDIIVNNAGIALSIGDLFKANKEDLMKEFEVNAVGPVLVTRSLDKSIPSNGAVVVNILSEAALIADDFLPGYSASKRAGLSFSQSIRSSYKEKDIRVLTVFPGITGTEGTQGFPGNKDDVTEVASEIVTALLDESVQYIATGENGKKAMIDWQALDLEKRL